MIIKDTIIEHAQNVLDLSLFRQFSYLVARIKVALLKAIILLYKLKKRERDVLLKLSWMARFQEFKKL